MKVVIPKLEVPASEAYVPSPAYVKPGCYAHEIEDLMNDWLAEKCPGWADDIPIPEDVHECTRIARRLESQILWIEANGRYGCRDHLNAFAALKPHLPFYCFDDAMARIRAAVKFWARHESPAEGG